MLLDSKPFVLVLVSDAFLIAYASTVTYHGQSLTVILQNSFFPQQVLARNIRTIFPHGLAFFVNEYAGSLTLYRTARNFSCFLQQMLARNILTLFQCGLAYLYFFSLNPASVSCDA
ncbi:hypothetical protein V6N11_057051 [Hibiscus sabdariffa]|uniref:Uncharacterized protein n=1 Tax=Hibiscus sabdariffa TaxID=183260 RepID=A0ABR1ZIA7_9ROSI